MIPEPLKDALVIAITFGLACAGPLTLLLMGKMVKEAAQEREWGFVILGITLSATILPMVGLLIVAAYSVVVNQ